MGVCLSWQDAVLAGHLKSNTYQRLMVAIIAKSTLYMGAFLLVRHIAASTGQQQQQVVPLCQPINLQQLQPTLLVIHNGLSCSACPPRLLSVSLPSWQPSASADDCLLSEISACLGCIEFQRGRRPW
jgi:hypothetical protein